MLLIWLYQRFVDNLVDKRAERQIVLKRWEIRELLVLAVLLSLLMFDLMMIYVHLCVGNLDFAAVKSILLAPEKVHYWCIYSFPSVQLKHSFCPLWCHRLAVCVHR